MKPTLGRKPRTGDKKLRVRFRNGETSRYAYPASALRWTDTGCEFDIIACGVDRG